MVDKNLSALFSPCKIIKSPDNLKKSRAIFIV